MDARGDPDNAAAPPGTPVPPLGFFQRFAGAVFRVGQGGGAPTGDRVAGWRLAEAVALDGGGFTLLFAPVSAGDGPPQPGQGIYRLEAPDGTGFDLFCVPVSVPGSGCGMEAIFNPSPGAR